jgi:hypothetical protein|tara:strand:- start:21252 stop:21485 length:234 start_codon:yes stop_codon:yes gene_type:complete
MLNEQILSLGIGWYLLLQGENKAVEKVDRMFGQVRRGESDASASTSRLLAQYRDTLVRVSLLKTVFEVEGMLTLLLM